MTRDAVTPWAERVVFGTTLNDKLAPWPHVHVKDHARARTGRVTPGRPRALALPEGHRAAVAVRPSDLDRSGGRARILHELANHELQAAELLALALLRWPDAPEGFRRSLVATLADEQRHCRLYLDRLAACGGTLGDQPVSRFFWDTLGPVTSASAFVAGLSLCFEVANLDFCLSWRAHFRAAGDPETADVLTTVHDDEVGHVARGLAWFTRWHPEHRVAAWVSALPPPLTAARARGPVFDVLGRSQAGFSTDEIDTLRFSAGSRGRPPRVLWFDATLEDRLAGQAPSAVARKVTADLATLPLFLAAAEDLVVAPAPRPAFLRTLADAGFAVPGFVDRITDDAVGGRIIAQLEPWGPGPERLPDVRAQRTPPPWDPRWAALSNKAETARRAARFAAHPLTVDDLGRVWTRAEDPGDGPWVLKAPFSTSGTRRVRGDGALTAPQRTWLDRQLQAHGAVLWQPWYSRIVDVSVHLTVTPEATVRIDGLTRFATSPAGSFTGTWLRDWTLGLDRDLLRVVHGDGGRAPTVETLLRDAARAAGTWAADLGYQGPLSVDAAIVHTPEGIRVHPWLETNARRTLGRVGLALRPHLAPRTRGWWHVARYTHEQAQALGDAPPITLRGGRLSDGVLATTDPTTSAALLTWLVVSSTGDPP